MKELGITPTDAQICEMAASAARACGGKRGTAKVMYEEDFKNVYLMARG